MPRLFGRLRSRFGGVGHVSDIVNDFASSVGNFANVTRNPFGHACLFFNCYGDGILAFIDLGDYLLNNSDVANCITRIRADRFDLSNDVFGGFGRLFGEFLDFVGNDRKAFASFAGACRFDGCVECQQVCLLRDAVDRMDDF